MIYSQHIRLAIALLSAAASLPALGQIDINQRLDALERRVESLEQRGLMPKAAISASRQQWRSLRQGMTMSEVRGILGEPGKVDTNQYFTTWHWNYPGGYVRFDGRTLAVTTISEP